MQKTKIDRDQEVARLVPISHLAAVVLESLDDLREGVIEVDEMDEVRRYQLRLLASFFDSARRGSLDDLAELTRAHAQSVARSTDDNRPTTRPPSLDDDYGSWKIVEEFTRSEPADAHELVKQGGDFVDRLLGGGRGRLEEGFAQRTLIPFLDRLAHADEKAAMQPIQGRHSLYS